MTEQIFESKLLSESYKKILHPSGLEVYLFKKNMSASYAIFGVKYGSIHNSFVNSDSPYEEVVLPDGIAHFLEHKLFANENGVDSFEVFSSLGADANAYTAFDKTAYLFSAAENFYESLEELIRFVRKPFFTKENVDSEIGIIAEEIKMYDDYPADRCFYGMLEGMYEHHSIKRNICGTEKSIKQITPELLYKCHESFYSLCNMGLFICGDVDEAKILEILSSLLPSEKEEFKISFKDGSEKELPTVYKPYAEAKMQVAKPLFNVGIKDVDIPLSVAERQKKEAVFSILDEMLFSRAGELYSMLFDADLISPHLSYGYSSSPTAAYNSIAGEADNPKLVLEKILEYLENLSSDSLSYEDFLRGKRILYSDFVKSFDSTEGIANNLLTFSFDGAELFSYLDIISSITLEDVKRAFESNAFDRSKITLSVILPLESKE